MDLGSSKSDGCTTCTGSFSVSWMLVSQVQLHPVSHPVTVRVTEFSTRLFSRWCRGVVVNALVAINEVTLRRAQLILGWVTVCGRASNLGM